MEDWLIEESDKVREMIKSYFTYDNWNKFPDILRYRYLVSTRNYLDTPFGETFMPKPEYMRYQKPLRDELLTESHRIDSEIINESDTKPTKRKPPTKRKADCEQVRKNPKRENIPEKNYYEEEQPKDDRYVFCDTCQEEYLDVCSKCGGLVSLEDNPVPRGAEDRAIKTAPKGVLEVRRSAIHGFGVFALKNLRKGVRLGPYVGNITRINTNNGYAWKLRDGKLVDANDATNSNYLRYVNCPRSVAEQNLVAFQYKGKLYYRTCREISAGDELLVYYGATFAKNLGIDPKKYFEPEEVHTIPAFYTCKFCFIGLGSEVFREKHQKLCRFDPVKTKVHEGEIHKCRFCGCGLTSKKFLEWHEKRCVRRKQGSGERKHGCSYCPKDFVYKSQLEVHFVEVHGKENGKECLRKIHACESCDYKSLNSSHFGQHQITHSKAAAKSYNCNHCKYTSFCKGNLKRHLRTHSGTFSFICIECKKNHIGKQQLDSHILKKHENNKILISSMTSKIYDCEFCDYRTIYSNHLKWHQLKHSKEKDAKQFICPDCNYSTSRKECFVRHSITHSDDYPYLCNECEKKFNQKTHLDSHILNNHKENQMLMESITNKIHRCQFCEYQAIKSRDFKRHVKIHNRCVKK